MPTLSHPLLRRAPVEDAPDADLALLEAVERQDVAAAEQAAVGASMVYWLIALNHCITKGYVELIRGLLGARDDYRDDDLLRQYLYAAALGRLAVIPLSEAESRLRRSAVIDTLRARLSDGSDKAEARLRREAVMVYVDDPGMLGEVCEWLASGSADPPCDVSGTYGKVWLGLYHAFKAMQIFYEFMGIRWVNGAVAHELYMQAMIGGAGTLPYVAVVGDNKDTVYAVSRRCQQTLAQRMAGRDLRARVREMPRLLARLLQVVAELHKKGVWHHDIKPMNLVLQDPYDVGSVVAIDPGNAQPVTAPSRTWIGVCGGTKGFMRRVGGEDVPDDLYAVVVTVSIWLGRPVQHADDMKYLNEHVAEHSADQVDRMAAEESLKLMEDILSDPGLTAEAALAKLRSEPSTSPVRFEVAGAAHTARRDPVDFEGPCRALLQAELFQTCARRVGCAEAIEYWVGESARLAASLYQASAAAAPEACRDLAVAAVTRLPVATPCEAGVRALLEELRYRFPVA